MRKPNDSLLIILTLLFASFIIGVMVGRMTDRPPVAVYAPSEMLTEPARIRQDAQSDTEAVAITAYPIDINSADAAVFMELPGVGEVLAKRIVAYRCKHGPFTAVEELLNVEGLGKQKLDEIWDLITIGG